MSQPNTESLVRFVLGESPQAEQATVQAWVASHGGGHAALSNVIDMVATLKNNTSVEAPREVIRRACSLVPAPTAQEAGAWWENLASAIATLVFDGRSKPMLAGYRGGSVEHMTFESDLGEIDLHIAPKSSGRQVRGQVSSMGHALGEVVFLAADNAVFRATPDRHGVFMIDVAPGAYRIVCRVGDRAMEIPSLHLT
jgi:hypothetical protein